MDKKFRFNIIAFIVAFLLGITYVYLAAPKVKNIIKYPTPFNSNKVVYKSYNEMCYKYNAEEVKCTANAINQPIL